MRRDAGLTLIETVMTIAIFTIVSLLLSYSIANFYKTNAYSIEQGAAISSARRAVEVLVQDIREATYSDEGGYPIISMDANTLYFYSDTDHDNNVERIRFFFNGDTFIKGVTNSAGNPLTYTAQPESEIIIAEDVRNPALTTSVFHYYDDTGTEILDYNDVLDVRFVEMNIIININPQRLPNDFYLNSSAALRNL